MRRTSAAAPTPIPILAPVSRLEMGEALCAWASAGSPVGGVTMGAANVCAGSVDAASGVSKEAVNTALLLTGRASQS
jgi:hypothetical protein